MTNLCKSGALNIFDSFEISGKFLACFHAHRLLLVLGEFLDGGGVVAQINLGSDEQERRLRAVMRDFRHPLQSISLVFK